MERRSYTSRFLCMTVLGFLLCPSVSVAEYLRTGPVTGTVCKGFVIEFCSYKVPIVAVKEKGRFYPVAESFESVDEYGSNTCHIRLDRGGMWTPLNWVLGTLAQFDDFIQWQSPLSQWMNMEAIPATSDSIVEGCGLR